MPKKQTKTISEQLRDAVRHAPVSRYQLSRESGVGESTLSRFVHGTAGLTLRSLDQLGQSLEIELIAHRKKDGD